MALDTLTVTLAVPDEIYVELCPKYDADGNQLEEDFSWHPEDDILAGLQDIIVDTGERLGLTVLPLFRAAGAREGESPGFASDSNLIIVYKPAESMIKSLCNDGMSRIAHSVVFGHQEGERPYVSVPVRELIKTLNIPISRFFMQTISERLINRNEVQETLKYAMEFAADPPFKFD